MPLYNSVFLFNFFYFNSYSTKGSWYYCIGTIVIMSSSLIVQKYHIRMNLKKANLNIYSFAF